MAQARTASVRSHTMADTFLDADDPRLVWDKADADHRRAVLHELIERVDIAKATERAWNERVAQARVAITCKG